MLKARIQAGRSKTGLLALCASLLFIGFAVHNHGLADPVAAGSSVRSPLAPHGTERGPCLACRSSHDKAASNGGPLIEAPPLPSVEPVFNVRTSLHAAPGLRRLIPRGPPASSLLDA